MRREEAPLVTRAPRVTYWTGTWDPAKEAISKEIVALRSGPRSGAPVVAFSSSNSPAWSVRDRVLTLSKRWYPVLRATGAAIEPWGDVTHVLAGHDSWELFRAVGRRPILFTAVVPVGRHEPLPHFERVARLAVESSTEAARWESLGVDASKIAVIRPGVDLLRFRPASAKKNGRFTLLFASSPSNPREIATRGVGMLIDVARRCPGVDILIPWRQWGDVQEAGRVLAALSPPANFIVHMVDVADMREYYARSHGTILCFDEAAGKTCPHFVLEGLASGLPCITTPRGDLSTLIARTGAGVATERDVASIATAVETLESDWAGRANRARRLAEEEFDRGRFLARYEALYRDVVGESAVGATSRKAGH